MNVPMFKLRNRSFLYALMLLCSFGLKACSSSDDELIPEEDPVHPSKKAVKEVTMSADNILSGNGGSRTSFTLESDRLKFAWAEGDEIGICTSDNVPQPMTIKTGVGENTATFDGGAYVLSETATYAAYYPYNRDNEVNNVEVRFSYEGQCQTGNGSLAHLGSHDLMATNATMAVDSKLNFKFKHLNSVAQFRLTVPVTATFTTLKVRCNEEPLFTKVANLNLTGSEYVYSAYETTNQLQMSLSDIASTDENKLLIIYMMLPPTDLAGKTVTVVLQSSDNRVYEGELAQKTMLPGYAYSFAATLVDKTQNLSTDSPNFDTEESI